MDHVVRIRLLREVGVAVKGQVIVLLLHLPLATSQSQPGSLDVALLLAIFRFVCACGIWRGDLALISVMH